LTSNTPSTSEVEHGVGPGLAPVQAVGQRRRGGLGDQAHDLEPGEPAGVARRLALGIVEVGRHGDHRALDRPAERRLGARPELAQDLGRDLDRRHQPPAGDPDPDRAVVTLELVGQHRAHAVEVLGAAADQPLDRRERVAGRIERVGLRRAADQHAAVGRVVHHRRHQRAAVAGEHLR
jgi:hypothetical protein